MIFLIYYLLTSWNVTVVDTAGHGFAKIDLDRNGSPHIIYPSTTAMIVYAYRVNGEWQKEYVATLVDPWDDCHLDLDTNDQPHIIFESRADLKIKHAYKLNHQWVIETIDNINGSITAYAYVDKNNIIHAAYPKNNKICYASKKNDIWQIETIETGNYYYDYPSITENNGYIYVSYTALVNNIYGYVKIAKRLENNWQIALVDYSLYPFFPAVNFDDNSTIHIFRNNNYWPATLLHTWGNFGGPWQNSAIDTLNGMGVALDMFGSRPYVLAPVTISNFHRYIAFYCLPAVVRESIDCYDQICSHGFDIKVSTDGRVHVVYNPYYASFDSNIIKYAVRGQLEVTEKPEMIILPEIKIYPSLFCQALTISCPTAFELSVYDVSGRMIKTMKSKDSQIDWRPEPGLPAGTYFVKIKIEQVEKIQKVIYLK